MVTSSVHFVFPSAINRHFVIAPHRERLLSDETGVLRSLQLVVAIFLFPECITTFPFTMIQLSQWKVASSHKTLLAMTIKHKVNQANPVLLSSKLASVITSISGVSIFLQNGEGQLERSNWNES